MSLAFLLLLSVIAFSSTSGKMGMRQCAACICEAASGCVSSNVKWNTRCGPDSCGPFYITRPYWAHAGSPTIHGQGAKDPLAFDNCVQDVFCAAKTVHNFMKNATTDCNQDGRIDCDDYVLTHKFGGGNCRQDLNNIGDYGKRYLHCKYLMNGLGPEEEEKKDQVTTTTPYLDIDPRIMVR